jgi:hypothetical protein
MRNEVKEGYPLEDFAKAWASHRKYTWLAWGFFLGWIPFGVFVIGPLERLRWDWAVFPALGIYLIGLIISSNLASRFRCPRCGSRYYTWGPLGLGHNGFARKCGNCRLRKWFCQSKVQAQEELAEFES